MVICLPRASKASLRGHSLLVIRLPRAKRRCRRAALRRASKASLRGYSLFVRIIHGNTQISTEDRGEKIERDLIYDLLVV